MVKPLKNGGDKLAGLSRFGWQTAARDGKALRTAGLFFYAHERRTGESRIPGLTRFGKAWAVPGGAAVPADAGKRARHDRL